MNDTPLPFDDVKSLIEKMPPLISEMAKMHEARFKDLIFPEGLESISGLSRHLSLCQQKHPPEANRLELALFAGAHGVASQRITKKTQQNVADYVAAIQQGTAPLNQICAQYGAGLKVFEVGADLPTEDITNESAMSEKEAVATVAFGMEAVAQGGDILALTSSGAGGNFIATVLAAYILGGEAEDWLALEDATGEAEFKRQIECFHAVKKRHDADYEPLELLRRVGGREIAALIGAIIAARYQSIPVLLDSLSALVAALLLKQMRADAVDHCLVAHVAEHQAFINILNALEMRPIIDMNFAPDGGMGAATTFGIIKSAVAVHVYTGHEDIKDKVKQQKTA
ncbi:MAG: nicotinate-nucleotide--dimethylbenzimidazole phosphoribosyltransferase [Pseudomonadota bacterium]